MERWSPYEQQYTQLSGGSPHLPPSAPTEDTINNFGTSNSNQLLLSCQGLPLSSTNDPTSASTGLPNSDYDVLSIQSSKENEFFDDTLYNGVCKENPTGGHNFIQAQGSTARNEAFPAENTPGYTGQVPSQQCHANLELSVSGSFGVLPHESVKNHPGRFERNNNDKFLSTVSYNNGPYTDRESSVYTSAPLSAQSAFSGDTASLSPVVNSVTSPSLSNFSSPSEYYSSPKTNFGAYNTLQSPVPLSPSVAQSYPSSPFANVDPVTHISSAPPCSPMSGGTYINNLNTVPQRNGQKTQHSPSNSATNMCYNTPQSQNMGYQSVLQKTPPDFHSEYSFPPEHNSSSSYSSVYPAMHPGQMSAGSNSRISPRTHTPHSNSIPHDGRTSYGHSNTMTQAPLSSPTYLQNKVNQETGYGACSSSINSGQSMHPPRFPPSMNHLRNNTLHQNPPSVVHEHLGNDRHFNFNSDLVDDKRTLDCFNKFVEYGNYNHDGNSITPYLDNIIDGDVITTNRQLRSSESDEPRQNCTVNVENTPRTMVSRPPVSKEPQKEIRSLGTLNYPYSSSHLDPVRPGNFTLNAPRRRGRRGRRRKADIYGGNMTRFQSFKSDRNIYSNGYPLQPSNNMLDYGNECYNNMSSRLCDEKELPPVNYPLSRYRSELKMTENQKKNSVILSKPVKKCVSIEEELRFLGDLKFPDEGEKDSVQTFMKTRNKDTEGFLQCYKNFLASRKAKTECDVSSDVVQSKTVSKDHKDHVSHVNKEHKSKSNRTLPKLIIKMGRCNNLREWRLTEPILSPLTVSDDESASESSGDAPLSSHIKKENDEEKSKRLKHSGKLNKLSERYSKHSANRKRTVARSDKYYDLKESSPTNSDTLPAGEIKVKPEIESSPQCDVQYSNSSKKRGRKAKNPPPVKSDSKKKIRKSSLKATETPEDASFVPVTIKQEIIDEDEEAGLSRRSLRSRKNDIINFQDTLPGPSLKKEKIDDVKDHIDLSSDEVDILDDSDSDPAWTPSVKTPKSAEAKGLQMQQRKRGPKPGRRASKGTDAPPKQKKEKVLRKKHSLSNKKESTAPAPNAKSKKQKEHFLVAREDIDKKTPFIWRVDKETNMLQRFEWYEQQGIILYRSTYTYAAWNEISFSNYVTANVRIVSHSRILYVVEYLGPDLSDAVVNPVPEADAPTTNPLRENFEVFLQTLISQALDPNFLTEITNENDEYFLNNIKEIEKITEEKKKRIIQDFWDDDIIKSVNTYPSFDLLDASDASECEVCKQENGSKQLKFHGQPYDWVTLGTVEILPPLKTQFNICDSCSATLSLYSHLQHQKYNFFIKCRTKMNEVKGTTDKMESHVLLEECLQDHNWVNQLFEELENMWKQCDEKS